MLLSLRLVNFKRHEELLVNFTSGLNVIMGPNYRGKSSILHGVLYALWGASALPCTADKIPRAGSTSFSVELKFLLGEDSWVIYRTKSKDEISKNGEPQATGKSAVAKKVETLLGMSQAQFLRLLYAEQKRAENLVSLGSADLNRTIEEVAGTSTVKDAITKLADIIRSATGAAEGVRSVMGEAPDPMGEEMLENAMLVARTAVGTTTGEHDAAVAASQAAQRATQALLLAERTRQGLEQAVRHAVAQEEQSGRALEQAPKASQQEVETLNAEVSRLTVAMGQARAEYTAARDGVTAWQRYEQTVQALQREEAALEPVPEMKALPVEAGALTKAAADVEASASALAVINAKVQSLSNAEREGICAGCKRPFANHDPEAIAQELAGVREQQLEASNELAQLKAHMTALQLQDTTYRQAEQEINKRATALAAFQQRKAAVLEHPVPEASAEALQGITARGNAIDAELTKAKRDHADKADALSRLDILIATNRAHVVARDMAREQLAADTFNPEALVVARDDEQRLGGVSFRAAAALAAKRDEFQEADHQLRNYRAAVTRYTQQSEKLLQHEQRAGNAKKLRTFLQENFDKFMSETWEGLLAMASHFTRMGTDGFISEILRSDDGKFEYVEEGEKFTVMGSGSGAQRSLMGLSMQIAMSEMLPCPLQVLMLDEASADMDPEVSAALVMTLRNLGKQVIIVSHRDMDAAVADNVIALE